MRHLFLAESDFGAHGAAFMWALVSIGQECRYYARRTHLYRYPHQPDGRIPLDPQQAADLLTEAVDWAEWVWVIQSDLPVVMGGTFTPGQGDSNPARQAWQARMRGKQIALLHGSGHYRDNRQYFVDAWKHMNPISFCYEGNLVGGFEREHMVIPPLAPEWVPFRPRDAGRLRVGHFPSRPTDKGSEWIVPMLAAKDGIEFRTSVTDAKKETGVARVPWVQQMQRMAECDAIVDQVKPEINGNRVGDWVAIASEAAALGRVSIVNCLDTAPYRATYGRDPGLHICNDADSLSAEIDRLAGLQVARLEEEQAESGEWFWGHHSIAATGALLKEVCGL